ncbi:hypothetical protein M3D75_02890 [Microbacterium enclense]|uniref:hypothetical protein n=1 Tax=Microbacterium enclense TaxID=993073 RepID=UPI0021A46DFB|nr:hypothetical protein [Microbacterium enclense]MCT2085054.1 hypothetical protein [Microbacterium enclense]
MNTPNPTTAAIDDAAEAASTEAYPNFEQLRRPFETGFRAGVRWIQNLARSARRGTDTRMIGSALEILPNAEHRAQLERHRADRELYEQGTTHRDGPRHVIVGERQEGKTTIAERWLLDAPDGVDRVLVTFSLAAAGEIKHRLGLKNSDPRVISFHSLTGPGRSARPDVEYGFDETVRILEQLLRLKQPPHLITITTAAEWQGRDA